MNGIFIFYLNKFQYKFKHLSARCTILTWNVFFLFDTLNLCWFRSTNYNIFFRSFLTNVKTIHRNVKNWTIIVTFTKARFNKLSILYWGKNFNTFSATCRNIAQRVILSSKLLKNQYLAYAISHCFYLLVYFKFTLKYNPLIK